MGVGSGANQGWVMQALLEAACGASLTGAVESYANGWRSLRVDRGVITEPRHSQAVTELLVGAQQTAVAAGYHDRSRAVFVSRHQWLHWSWCTRGQSVPQVASLARVVADALNPGTWSVFADPS